MDIKKTITYTIVILWLIAGLLDLKDEINSKHILLMIANMAFFIEGRVPEHLPESILGSFTIKDLRILQEN